MSKALPERLATLKSDLVAAIPCAPEELKLKAELAAKPLDRVITYYLTWVDRLIPPRTRRVVFGEDFWKAPKSDKVLQGISTLHQKATLGEDLSPYLSRFSLTHGYTGEPSGKRRGPSWADGGRGDKDFAVHVYETHHLHFVPSGPNLGRRGNSDDLLFVNVNRYQMRFLMTGTHKTFDSPELRAAAAKARRDDGWALNGMTVDRANERDNGVLYRKGLNVLESIDGQAVAMGLLSTAGTGLAYTRQSDKIMIFLEEWEEKLGTAEGVREFAEMGKIPSRYFEDFKWGFWFGDFCLVNGRGQGVSLIPWAR